VDMYFDICVDLSTVGSRCCNKPSK